jgi:hypothetical protein
VNADLVEDLRRRLRRWRLATFILSVVLVSFVAIAGTFGVLMMLELQDQRELMLQVQEAEERARAQAEDAAVQAQRTRQQAEAARQQVKGEPGNQ